MLTVCVCFGPGLKWSCLKAEAVLKVASLLAWSGSVAAALPVVGCFSLSASGLHAFPNEHLDVVSRALLKSDHAVLNAQRSTKSLFLCARITGNFLPTIHSPLDSIESTLYPILEAHKRMPTDTCTPTSLRPL